MKDEQAPQFSGSPVREFQLLNKRANPQQQLTYTKRILGYYSTSTGTLLQNSTTKTSLFNLTDLDDYKLLGGCSFNESVSNITTLQIAAGTVLPSSSILIQAAGIVSDSSGAVAPPATMTLRIYAFLDLALTGLIETPIVVSTGWDGSRGQSFWRAFVQMRVGTDFTGSGSPTTLGYSDVAIGPWVALGNVVDFQLSQQSFGSGNPFVKDLRFAVTAQWDRADTDLYFTVQQFLVDVIR